MISPASFGLASMLDVDMFEAVKEKEEKNRKRESRFNPPKDVSQKMPAESGSEAHFICVESIGQSQSHCPRWRYSSAGHGYER
jgi:hypothetical protein